MAKSCISSEKCSKMSARKHPKMFIICLIWILQMMKVESSTNQLKSKENSPGIKHIPDDILEDCDPDLKKNPFCIDEVAKKMSLLDEIHEISIGNIQSVCQTGSYKTIPINLDVSKYGLSMSESKVMLASRLIEDLQSQDDLKLLQSLIRNLIKSQSNFKKVTFVDYSPWFVVSGHSLDGGHESIIVKNSSIGFDEKSTPPWFVNRMTSLETLESRFLRVNSNPRRLWTHPYFSCETKTWSIAYVTTIHRLQQQGSPTSLLVAEIDLSSVDINQCDLTNNESSTNEINDFSSTHKCQEETSQCEYVSGSGWVKGSYNCICKKGYFRNYSNANSANETFLDVSLRDENNQGSPPYDHLYYCTKCLPGCDSCVSNLPCLAYYNWTFRYILLCVSLLCFIMTFVMAALVYNLRKLRVFKLASPSFLCITLTGCAIMYLEMVAIFPYLDMYFCIATKWTRHLGFLITYSALLMKTWRVSLTYRVKSAHKLKLTDKQLLQWMLPILMVMVTYLAAWTISDPPEGIDIVDVSGLKFKQCTYGWWDHSLAFGEMIFLLWGIRVCYNVRKARTQFDEAKLIRWSIYNITVVNIIMAALHLLIAPHAGPDTKYLLGFLRTQLGTSVTIALVFGPKFHRVIRGTANELDDRQRGNNVSILDGPIDREEDMENGDKNENKDLEQENEELKEEIQKLAGHIEHMKIVGMLTDNRHIRMKKDGYFTKENLLKQLDHLQPHFSISSNNQQNGGNSLAVKTDTFRRSHSVKAANLSLEDGRHKWSARTMPKSVVSLNPKSRKHKCKHSHNDDRTSTNVDPDFKTVIVDACDDGAVQSEMSGRCITNDLPTKNGKQHAEEVNLTGGSVVEIKVCIQEPETDEKQPNSVIDEQLAENINWFLSDGLAKDESDPNLGKKPDVNVEVPEVHEEVYACCSKKKSRKKKKLSYKKGNEESVPLCAHDPSTNRVHGETQTSPCDFNSSEVSGSKNSGTNGKSKTKTRSGCKHSDQNTKSKDSKASAKDPNPTTTTTTLHIEPEEDSLIGSNILPDHVKSLIPERV